MAQINPYINFNGNAEEAFNFYKSVFGGEFGKITRFKDIASAEFPVEEKDAEKIMRIVLPIGNNILIANDIPESMGRVNENENRSKIAITAAVKMRQTRYLTDSRSAALLKCLWRRVLGVHTLRCLETNTGSNGRWILTQSIKGKRKNNS